MLFEKRNQKKLKAIWTVLAVIMVIGMVLLYIPGLFG